MIDDMDRYWFLTWTTYGSWLPGDPRGFVGTYRDETGAKRLDNTSGEPYAADRRSLAQHAKDRLRGPPVMLRREHAEELLRQFAETARRRGWRLRAVAVMSNHVHIVVGVPGDPDPERILADFKSYGSRSLNRRWGKRPSATWWTESGSKRPLKRELAVVGAIEYVKRQEYPLALWSWEDGPPPGMPSPNDDARGAKLTSTATRHGERPA
jgi:REP element-mobilizing transposase RayT